MEITVRIIPATRVAAIEHIGPYPEIGAKFQQLFVWAGSAGLLPPASSELEAAWGIACYYDDPSVTPSNELRSDACIMLPDGFTISKGVVRELIIPAGSYAATIYTGPYSGLSSAWPEFMNYSQSQTNHQPDLQRPCMEFYIDDCNAVPPETMRTELLIPVIG